MKHISDSRKSQAIKALAMKEYRKTREKISKENPMLLKKIKNRITGDHIQMPLSVKTSQLDQGMISIDKDKNMNTIHKMLELTPPSAEFQRKLKQILIEVSS